MDAVKFQKELARMCRSYTLCADGCPSYGNGCAYSSEVLGDLAEKYVEIVERWSKENPVVTNGDEVIKSLPVEVKVYDEWTDDITIRVPKKWWNAEYKGEE